MAVKDVIEKNPKRAYMLTNEAIVRSALEEDVKVVSFYPGAPQTEVLDTFEKVLGSFDYRMEIAANEKVALETVAGAAMVGMRSLTSMKSVGTNVASDALYSLAYTGVRGGCICCIADDPYAHSSQSEQDGRWFGYTSYLPMLEPSDPQEAMDMIKAGFRISEKYGSIVLMRTTTRVNHQSGIVQTNELKRTPFQPHPWEENHPTYATVGATARDAKLGLIEKMDRMKEDPGLLALNRIEYFDGKTLHGSKDSVDDDCEFGVISAGVCYNYALESLMKLETPAHILKIGVLNPIPEKLIRDFLKQLKKLVIVEELFPYLENFAIMIAKDANIEIEVYGKSSGHFSEALEYNIPIVMSVMVEVTGKELPFDHLAYAEKIMKLADILPTRLPVFCAGCPHRATFWSLYKALGDRNRVFFSNDIGCYSMACLEPISWTDSLLCMGASMGIGAGVQYATEAKVVAMIGDSTLFHAGLPGIVNAVHNQDNITLFILDNSVTAMTGQQTHPAHQNKAGGMQGNKLDIEAVLKGLGVEKIVQVNSYDVMRNIKLMKEALDYRGLSVVISKQECALYHFRNYRHAGGKIVPFFVDNDVCRNAYTCIRDFMCPAISIDQKTGHSQISPDICVGCGVCARICGFKAIKSTAVLQGGDNRPYIELEDYRNLQETIAEEKDDDRDFPETMAERGDNDGAFPKTIAGRGDDDEAFPETFAEREDGDGAFPETIAERGDDDRASRKKREVGP